MLPRVPDDTSAALRAVSESFLVLRRGSASARELRDRYVPVPLAIDPAEGARRAAQYDALETRPRDSAVRAAYAAFARETRAQYRFLRHRAPWLHVRFTTDDPYQSSAEMLASVARGELRVYKTPARPNGHPVLTARENDQFRCVHDALTHAAYRLQFGARGEDAAYRAHAPLYSELARSVLATETRGQNSWVNFGPFAHLPAKERPYAAQKAAIWPLEH